MTDPPFHFEIQERLWQPGEELTFTIRARGEGMLSKGSFNALGRPEAVIVLFDTERRTLALQPASREDRNAYVLNATGRSETSTRSFSMKRVAIRHGIPLGVTRRYA